MFISFNKKLIFPISLIFIIISLGFFGFFYINQNTDYVQSDVDYQVYDSLNSLERDSNLIVIGEPNNISNFVLKDGDIIDDGYTITNFKIDKILSQINHTKVTDEITVIEPYFDYELSIKQKLVLKSKNQIITSGEYIPMEEGNKYILFLDYVEEENMYLINGIHQGSHRIYSNSETTKHNDMVFEDKGITNLKESIDKKYKEEIQGSILK